MPATVYDIESLVEECIHTSERMSNVVDKLSRFDESELFKYIIKADPSRARYVLLKMGVDFLSRMYEYFGENLMKTFMDQFNESNASKIFEPLMEMYIKGDYTGFEDILFNLLRTENPSEVISGVNSLNNDLPSVYVRSVCPDKATFMLIHADYEDLVTLCESDEPLESVRIVLRRWNQLIAEGCEDIPKQLVEIANRNLGFN